MALPGASVHAARVTAKSPWATWRANKTEVDLADDMVRGCKQFAAMRLSAVVLAHTTSSVVGGKGWDAATVASMSAAPAPGVIATTNGLDTLAALKASGLKRPFAVLPPWFPDLAVAAGLAYYKDHGFEMVGHLRYDPGRSWRDIPPGDLYATAWASRRRVEPLYAQIRAACSA